MKVMFPSLLILPFFVKDKCYFNYMLAVIPAMHITPEKHNSHKRVTQVYV
jgi:hypothetical protein